MAKPKAPLTPEEVKTAIDSLDLEGQIAILHYVQTKVDDHQKYIASQLELIEKAKLNGKAS